MSQRNYSVNLYGIVILPESTVFDKIVEKLAVKFKDVYEKVGEDAIDFVNELSEINELSISFVSEVEDLSLFNLNEENNEWWAEQALLLLGEYNRPNLYSSPFSSKEECADFHKKKFGDILPQDFDYMANIGEISYVIWG